MSSSVTVYVDKKYLSAHISVDRFWINSNSVVTTTHNKTDLTVSDLREFVDEIEEAQKKIKECF